MEIGGIGSSQGGYNTYSITQNPANVNKVKEQLPNQGKSNLKEIDKTKGSSMNK